MNESSSDDLLGTEFKAIQISEYIYRVVENWERRLTSSSNMIALYGTWGSGKSKVMEMLGNMLQEKSVANIHYKFIIFNAWEYEDDDNVMLSFIDFVLDNINCNRSTRKKIIKSANWIYDDIETGDSFFDSIVKSVKSDFNMAIHKNPNDSYYYQRESLIHLLGNVLRKFCSDDKILVINIDDLERCNPDKVIDMIVQLKHIFSVMPDVIFVVTMDQEAVLTAVDKITSNGNGTIGNVKNKSYLEKLFYKSFYMPSADSLELDKFVSERFDRMYLTDGERKEFYPENFSRQVSTLFSEVGFNNPRKVEQIIEKYFDIILLKGVKFNESDRLIYSYFSELIKNSNNERFDSYDNLCILILSELIVTKEYESLTFETYKNLINKQKIYEEKYFYLGVASDKLYYFQKSINSKPFFDEFMVKFDGQYMSAIYRSILKYNLSSNKRAASLVDVLLSPSPKEGEMELKEVRTDADEFYVDLSLYDSTIEVSYAKKCSRFLLGKKFISLVLEEDAKLKEYSDMLVTIKNTNDIILRIKSGNQFMNIDTQRIELIYDSIKANIQLFTIFTNEFETNSPELYKNLVHCIKAMNNLQKKFEELMKERYKFDEINKKILDEKSVLISKKGDLEAKINRQEELEHIGENGDSFGSNELKNELDEVNAQIREIDNKIKEAEDKLHNSEKFSKSYFAYTQLNKNVDGVLKDGNSFVQEEINKYINHYQVIEQKDYKFTDLVHFVDKYL